MRIPLAGQRSHWALDGVLIPFLNRFKGWRMSDNNNENEALLLVDDNPTNLQVLYQTLETTGCKLLGKRPPPI
jgi:hypothetical protein